MKNINPFEKRPGKIEQTCPKCYGLGKDQKGNRCNVCNGSGKVLR